MTDPVVDTGAGPVRGFEHHGTFLFRGIPFGAPPVGPRRRFCPPVPVEPWNFVRDCLEFGPGSPQSMPPVALEGLLAHLSESSGPANGTSEDCLNLNVWTPGLDDARRPTMVWIHGGGFTVGSGSAVMSDGTTFARDGVVFVSINYRLHALGSLYLDEDFDGAAGSGNAGILDQVLALQWVRDNIGAFGGDPDNVTILGESAGAMSVAALLGTQVAHGLFRHAIMESGSASVCIPADVARECTQRFLSALDVTPGDWEALAAVPLADVVAAASRQTPLSGGGNGAMTFAPVVDGVTRDAQPLELVRQGAARGVDVLAGWNRDEMRLFQSAIPPEMQAMLPEPDLGPLAAAAGTTAAELRATYEQERPDESPADLALAVQTDQSFGMPTIALAEAVAANGGRSWLYRFDWRTPVMDGTLGACHVLEQPFAFDWDLPIFTGDDPPTVLRKAMHGAWLSFARTGDPNGEGLPAWPEYDDAQRTTMLYDDPPHVVDDPSGAVRQLWAQGRGSG